MAGPGPGIVVTVTGPEATRHVPWGAPGAGAPAAGTADPAPCPVSGGTLTEDTDDSVGMGEGDEGGDEDGDEGACCACSGEDFGGRAPLHGPTPLIASCGRNTTGK